MRQSSAQRVCHYIPQCEAVKLSYEINNSVCKIAEVKPCELRGNLEQAILIQARKGRSNDYPKGVHSSEWKRMAHVNVMI